MEIIKVKRTAGGFTVNDRFFIPEDENDENYKAIKKKELKGFKITPEFTEAELLQIETNKKKSQIKAKEKSLICELYSVDDRLDILMSGDSSNISSMNAAITKIKDQSRAAESEIEGLATLKKVKAYDITKIFA